MANKRLGDNTEIGTITGADFIPIISGIDDYNAEVDDLATYYTIPTIKTNIANLDIYKIGGDTIYGGTISTNLDTITKSGFYTCYGTATGVPSSSYSWYVIHQNSNAGTVSATQRAVAFNNELIIFERTKVLSSWGQWISTQQNIIQWGTCLTASATASKEVTLSNYQLNTGSLIIVTFDNTNTNATPTINVNSTGAKSLVNIYGDAIAYLPSGTKIPLFYDDTNWVSLLTNSSSNMPDYPNVVNKTWGNLYTAELDGWIYAYSGNYTAAIEINSVSYSIASSGTASNSGVIFMPIAKDDTYKGTGGYTQVLKFFPAKGAN